MKKLDKDAEAQQIMDNEQRASLISMKKIVEIEDDLEEGNNQVIYDNLTWKEMVDNSFSTEEAKKISLKFIDDLYKRKYGDLSL
jgi:hypothetical protein